jgi:predicted  nucleic acid-binding Zn-ribbon protein
MFLVELSYNTIKEEIKDLDLKKDRKKYALKDSSTKLKKDSAKLIQFIESDNMTTSDRTKEADLAVQERKNAETKIKKYEANIQGVKSEIDKNFDQLTALEEHKEFLLSIFEKDNPKWVEDQLNKKR